MGNQQLPSRPFDEGRIVPIASDGSGGRTWRPRPTARPRSRRWSSCRTTGRLITIADFAFPDRRVAVYVDGMSIHLGEVLRRDRRIEERLRTMSPSWTVFRLGRRDIDGDPQRTVERVTAVTR